MDEGVGGKGGVGAAPTPLLQTHAGSSKVSVIAGEAANTGLNVGHREQFLYG